MPGERRRSYRANSDVRPRLTNWAGQAAIDAGKPLPGKEGLTTAEREELTRLRRQVRQLQMERDILAKATAWFAGKSGGAPTSSSNS